MGVGKGAIGSDRLSDARLVVEVTFGVDKAAEVDDAMIEDPRCGHSGAVVG